MLTGVPAATPEPPYCAMIFTAVRTDDDTNYVDTYRRMRTLAAEHPGYLGIDSAGDAEEITVSYWASDATAASSKRRRSS